MYARFATCRLRLHSLHFLLAWWLLCNALLWQSGYGMTAQLGRSLLCSASAGKSETGSGSESAHRHCSWCVQLKSADVLPLSSVQLRTEFTVQTVQSTLPSVWFVYLGARAYRARAPPKWPV